jgi:uncharacterized protein YoxC
MIIEISVAVIALAFVALVIYLISLVRSLQVTLGKVNEILKDGHKQLDAVVTEAKKVMEQTTHIGAGIQKKVDSFDPIFKTVEDLGEIIENRAAHLRDEVTGADSQTETHSSTYRHTAAGKRIAEKRTLEKNTTEKSPQSDIVRLITDIIELTSLGIRLWQNFKKRR